jgi:DNA-binding SARP family transcriptional activator/Tfp pilus assembly protein PilF
VQVRLLGPVDVVVDGTAKPVPGLRRRAVLAALALRPGEVVSTDLLIDVVWGDGAPAAAATTLQSHVSRLRRLLGGPTAILARPPGYVLNIGAQATDVQAAEGLIGRGMRSRDPEDRETSLRAAVALWRGRPLADLTGLAPFDDHAQRLEHLLLQARHALIDTRLMLGQHAELIPELETLCREHPLHEQIHRQLMIALYRTGRQSDALATYQRLRRTLDEEIGIEPSQPLRDLETAILRQAPALDAPPPALPVAAVPAQLPPATSGFTGRSHELAYLDSLLPNANAGGLVRPTAVVISAISGSAGIGKTSLATHWAHRVAARFPDGQLYANLRGFDPGRPPMEPAEAVRGFLDALGVPHQRIPVGLDAQVGVYRSRLAGKQVLVVLDNARDVEQVRPLLPGSGGCLVIVTSRNQLAPLVAAEGAHPVTLDLLTDAEARDLLVHRLGADRVAAEPAAVEAIIARCARLPLALAIVAARAATHPGFPLAALAGELRQSIGSLDTFHGGDLATDVRAVFSWSYQTLSAEAARLFRLLGLHPGPDLTAPAVASLAAITPHQARMLLTELTRAHLLSEHTPGRYAFHDLLRAYATEQAHIHDDDGQRHAAVHRMFDHYLHTAHTAALLLYPQWDPVTLTPHRPGTLPEHPADHQHALAWFTAEHAVLLAAVNHAAALGFDTHAWQLAWSLDNFFDRRGHWHDQVATGRVAVRAAERQDDSTAQAHAHRLLANAYLQLGHHDEAQIHLHQGLRLCRQAGDLIGQARVHNNLARAWERQGRPTEALDHARQALDLFKAAGHRAGQAVALNNSGWLHVQLGEYQQALTACRQALTFYDELGDRHGQATTWDSIGYGYHHLRQYTEAIACYQRAIDLYREDARSYRSRTLTNLGDTHHAAGNLDAAHKAWQQALDILDQLHHPDATQVRARLNNPAPDQRPVPG